MMMIVHREPPVNLDLERGLWHLEVLILLRSIKDNLGSWKIIAL